MTGAHIRHKYDQQEALTLYLCGMKISDIAAEYDVPYSTIYSFLRDRVEIRGDQGHDLQEKCFKGHSMDDAIITKRKDGTERRSCRQCTRARDNAYKRRKYADKKKQKENAA